jgi:glyoxylase-like metal-dependent hydrolase (beta-lactamase superfamily II)
LRVVAQTAISLRPGVFRLGSPIVNWYAVEEDGRLTVVDAGLPKHADGLEEALGGIGHGLADIEAAVLTHGHSDHTGIAGFLHDRGVPVHIHAEDGEVLASGGRTKNEGGIMPYLRYGTAWRMLMHLAQGGGLRPPRIDDATTFGDGDLLDVPGRPRVVGTPGHTNGHCAFHFEGHGTLFAGDALCTWNPLTGRPGPQIMPAAFDMSTDRCLESLGRIEGIAADLLLPGHGEPWMEGPAEAVARAREAGRS